MQIARESVYAALFDRLASLRELATASRRLKHWSDVPAAAQPALYLVQRNERPRQTRGQPAAWTLQALLYLYVNAGSDPDAVPASSLNRLLDAIETALAPDAATGVQSLGGLVSHCWIDGSGIETDEGVLGAQAVAIVPINILVP